VQIACISAILGLTRTSKALNRKVIAVDLTHAIPPSIPCQDAHMRSAGGPYRSVVDNVLKERYKLQEER